MYFFKSSGFWVEFRKDIFNEQFLQSVELSERQIKALRFLKENSKINNSDYQTLNEVSGETATRDLKLLIEKHLIKPSGEKRSWFILYAKMNCVIIAS
ncbi:MAG: hypothetical protein SNJ77_10215 [Cytophagales bacterium]